MTKSGGTLRVTEIAEGLAPLADTVGLRGLTGIHRPGPPQPEPEARRRVLVRWAPPTTVVKVQ